MNNLLNKNFISGFIFASIALTFILIVLSRFFINSNNEPSILTDTPEKAALLFFEFALKGDEKKLKRLLIEPPQDYFVECPEIISAKND
ncbi:MAG TPA: hypothetical protein PKY59_11180, partial [Pyrinomonadaceae bacterium]|nr:hypothetical protein [Pyrinomonadaceae bacterium]